MRHHGLVRGGSHAFLALALFFFFYTPEYAEHFSLVVLQPRAFLSALLRPGLLKIALFVWIFVRSDGISLAVARFLAFVPVIYLLSLPHLPSLLLRPVFAGPSLLMGPIALVWLSCLTPTCRDKGMSRKLCFVLWGLASYATFFFVFFLVMMHGDSAPLALATALFLMTLVSWARLASSMRGPSHRWLMGGYLVWSLCLIAFLLARGSALNRDSSPQTSFHVGPYLQNLKPDGVTVMWETEEPSQGWVTVSPEDEVLSEAVARVEAPESKIHEVVIEGLQEDTSYRYTVVSDEGQEEQGIFRTAIAAPGPFQFVVYADCGNIFDWSNYLVAHRHRDVCRSIQEYSPDARFIMHVGDMTFLGKEYPRWKKEFFDPATELMRNKVLWTTLGNHEQDSPWYFNYFSIPNEDEHFYSFDFGDAHFTVLAVEGYASGHTYGPPEHTPLEPGSPQYEWLKRDLDACQDQTWKFVFFHHAALSSGVEGNYRPALEILVPLFQEKGVDVVFSGHDHHYEYSVKDEMPLVVTGGGGSFLEPVRLNTSENPYSRYIRQTWHHCRVNVDPQLRRVTVEAIDLQGRLVHRFTVDKAR